MGNKNRKYIILAAIALVIAYVIYDAVSLPSASDLKGNFKEVATYRNPNNTGPIKRIYAVTVQGEPWEEMQQYGDLMPYTKYGTTTVFFFSESGTFPQQIQPNEPYFDPSLNDRCIASYEKDANGQITFEKKPFSNR